MSNPGVLEFVWLVVLGSRGEGEIEEKRRERRRGDNESSRSDAIHTLSVSIASGTHSIG
jgi:hypothetical protein